MRFISKTPSYHVTAIKPRETQGLGPNGRIVGHTEDAGFIAEFSPHGLTAWEMDKARELWADDYAGRIPRGGRLENRFGVFDTKLAQAMFPDEIPSDERREEIEQGLLNSRSHGVRFFHVERPRLPAPWPSYDDIVTAQGVTKAKVAEQIVELVQTTGVDLEHVITYERENLNRQEVIDAVEALKSSGEAAVAAVTVEA